MTNGTNNNWNTQDQAAKESAQAQGKPAGAPSDMLLSLLGQTSIMGSQRNVPEINDVTKSLEEHIETMKKSSLRDAQRAILPEITVLSKQISTSLPGIALHILVNNVVYVEPFLFSNRALTNALEDISMNDGQSNKTVSMPITPISYVRKDLIEQIRDHFTAAYRSKGAREIVIANFRVLDLEQFATDEVKNNGKVNLLRETIMRSWEQGLNVIIAKTAVVAGLTKLPPVYGEGNHPFGQFKSAIARTEPVVGQNTHEGIPTPANLSVRLQTTNNNNNGFNNNQESSKELVTAFVNVTLAGQALANYRPSPQVQQQNNYYPMMGQSANGRPAGYYPLIPVMIYDHARSGEQIGDNSGLAAWFLGLFASMASNSNYLFTEGLRGKNIGMRGNLVAAENIIRNAEIGNPIARDKTKILTEQKLQDMDYLNAWIKENIAPHAVFAVDIAQFGKDSAINNFLSGLNEGSAEFTRNVQVAIAMIDSLCNGAFSAQIALNQQSGKGWMPGKPILRPSNVIIPVGTVEHEGVLYDMGEVDEIKLSSLFPNDPIAIGNWMKAIYGDRDGTTEKVRQYRIRLYLQTFFNSHVNLNGFGTRSYIDPEFMETFGKAMSSIGNLQATGSMGTFRNDIQIYASGLSYMTTASVGNVGGFVGNGGGFVGNGTGLVFGG